LDRPVQFIFSQADSQTLEGGGAGFKKTAVYHPPIFPVDHGQRRKRLDQWREPPPVPLAVSGYRMKGSVCLEKPRFGNCVPEPPGGNPGKRFESFAKGAGRFIPYLQGDVDRSPATVEEQKTGTLHPFTEHIRMGSLPHDAFENPVEMEGRIAGRIGQVREPAMLVHMPVHVQHHPLDGAPVANYGGGAGHDPIVIIGS
jgi:hypothetical protein